MSFLSALQVALAALLTNKGRSILTSLGIVIGISAVIAMVSAGDGARYKLDKLVWDLIGSEFAGRHMLYEKFYAGNSIIVRNQSDREAPWEKFHGIVDGLLDDIAMPEA